MNSSIAEEVRILSSNPKINFVDQMVSVCKDTKNPFLPPNFNYEKFTEKKCGIYKNAVDLYCNSGISLDFDLSSDSLSDADKYQENPNVTNLSSTSLFQKNERQNTPIETPFSFRSSSDFFHLSPNESSTIFSLGQSKFLTFELSSFKADFASIEPILCDAFLYSAETRQILSDHWYFTFDNSILEMSKRGINYKCSNDVTFQVNGKLNDNSIYLFVILSHPLTVDNSSSILKYYQNPTESNKKDAIKNINDSFPKNSTAFSQFAWTFIDVNSIGSSKRVLPPNFFIMEKPMLEHNIIQMISDAQIGKYKQIQSTIIFNKSIDSENVILSKVGINYSPFLVPIHQLVVSIKAASVNTSISSGRNILIKTQLLTKEDKAPIKCFYTNLSPTQPSSVAYSSCFYHDKSPQFNDTFVVDLPFPLNNGTCLSFEVVHVHAKKDSVQTELLGTCTYQLTKNDVVQTGSNIEIPLKTSDKKQSSISISVALRSSFSTTDENLNKLRKTGDIKLIHSLSNETIIMYLMEILDIYIKSFSKGSSKCDFDVLFKIQEAADSLLSSISFDKYLIFYARFLAIKDSIPIRGIANNTNLSLKELSQSRGGHLEKIFDDSRTDNLISLDWTNSPLNYKPIAIHNRSNTHFNMEQGTSIGLHTKIIKAMTEYLKEKPLANISHFIDFLFILSIKSIAVTPYVVFDGLKELCVVFSESAVSVIQGQWRPYISYGVFAMMLFDLGFAEEAIHATNEMLEYLCCNTPVITEQLVAFVDLTFKPLNFLMFIRHSVSFRKSVINILEEAMTNETSNLTKQLIKIVLRCCSFYPKDVNTEIGSYFIETLNKIEATRLPSLNQASSLVSLLVFIISNASAAALKDADQKRLLEIAHYLLKNVNTTSLMKQEQKKCIPLPKSGFPSPTKSPIKLPTKTEQASHTDKILVQIHTGINQFILNMCQITPVDNPEPLLNLTYHMVLTKVDESLFSALCGMITTMIKYFSPFILKVSSPPLSKVLWKLLHVLLEVPKATPNEARIIAQPFIGLFETDFEKFRNSNRSTVIAMRALTLLTEEELTHPSLLLLFEFFDKSPIKALCSFSACYKNIRNNCLSRLKNNIEKDLKVGLLMQRVFMLRTCPEAQVEILSKIAESHLQNDNKVEYFNVVLLMAIIVLEYGCIIGTIPNLFGEDHCCKRFASVFPLALYCECPEAFVNDLPKIPGFCSNVNFTQAGFLSYMDKCFEHCINNQLTEYIYILMDYVWPLLEYNRLYQELEVMFNRFGQAFETFEANQITSEMFFRVELIGDIFGEENGMSFIYHANKYTKIYNLADQIIKSYSEVCDGTIESLQTQLGKLDPTKGYVKVTSVRPYNKDHTQHNGGFHLYNKFYYEDPFVPGSNKLQGSVEDQWIRRTIVKTNSPLPSVVRRVPIIPEEIKIKEIEPIRVAYRQIRERVEKIDEAIAIDDFQTIQQLLHGSLLVQVNEGPVKIAEVFMKGDGPYVRKLKYEFGRFIDACDRGVKKHSEWTASNQSFAVLQEQYESSFDTLKEKIKKLIQGE